MSNHAHDYNKILALLKSVAAPCDTEGDADHVWRECRHCLAIQELERRDVRALLKVFCQTISVMDEGYGRVITKAEGRGL